MSCDWRSMLACLISSQTPLGPVALQRRLQRPAAANFDLVLVSGAELVADWVMCSRSAGRGSTRKLLHRYWGSWRGWAKKLQVGAPRLNLKKSWVTEVNESLCWRNGSVWAWRDDAWHGLELKRTWASRKCQRKGRTYLDLAAKGQILVTAYQSPSFRCKVC